MKKLVLLACLVIPMKLHALAVGDLEVLGSIISDRLDVSTIGSIAVIGFIDGSSQTTAANATEISAATAALSVPIIFKDEGTDLSTGTVVNFVGAGVVATNTGSTITVTIAGGGGGGGGGGAAAFDGTTTVSFTTISIPGVQVFSFALLFGSNSGK